MAAAMNAQDTFQIDGRVVFLSGPGGYLGRGVAIPLGNQESPLLRTAAIRVDSATAQLLASRALGFFTGAVLTADGRWTAW
jgi:hypothetical protein